MTTSPLLRVSLAAAALASGLAHVPVTAEHLRDAPYMGWAFVVFAGVCGALAVGAAVRDSAAVYVATTLWCGAGLATFVATRLIAFPLLHDDVGRWAEPWGLASLASEALTVLLGVCALRGRVRAIA